MLPNSQTANPTHGGTEVTQTMSVTKKEKNKYTPMNYLQNEIDDYERLERFSGPAKRIMEKIKPLKSNVDVARRRWFWELLQNASDYNDTVDIELELTRDFIKFRHNGNPFTYKDARNLVEHVLPLKKRCH